MKINHIVINNLGPYEGEYDFNFKTTKNKNIILLGGKNGAGKTSLFTAIRLCLYGCKSMGYDNQSAKYIKEIHKFINDKAKYSNNYVGSVTLDIDVNNGHEIDKYTIKRSWVYNKSLDEELVVKKNNIDLEDEQIYDFEKYILSVIPPDVFDLYFFDGEKIVDYFLKEDGNKNLKSAIMCISGFNVFNIIKENFERNQNTDSKDERNYKEYIEFKNEYERVLKNVDNYKKEYNILLSQNKSIDTNIKANEKKFKTLGGLNKDEWNNILAEISDEESKRAERIAIFKKEANDSLPFLLLNKLISKLNIQINKEENNKLYNNFCEVFYNTINDIEIDKKLIEAINRKAETKYKKSGDSIYNLSIDETRELLYQLNFLKDKSLTMFKNIVSENDKSLKKCSILKDKLENCSNDNISKFVSNKEKLLNEKEMIINEINILSEEMGRANKELEHIEKKYFEKKSIIENQIKNCSIGDLSTRSLLMLDSLEKELYQEQILKIRKGFAKNIKVLMRKEDFINDIDIDNNFVVTAFKDDEIDCNDIINVVTKLEDGIYLNKLLSFFKLKTKKELIGYLNRKRLKVRVPVIIDFSKISNGEKQIFIMALYQSIIDLSSTQVPFVIDTPFARTDEEHREKISKYFFPNLNGQVIILSTNAEIDKKYKKMMDEHISNTYLLTNEGKATEIFEGKYF